MVSVPWLRPALWICLSLSVTACLNPYATAQSANSLAAPWQPLGPSQVLTASFGNITGRVTAIAVDPADPTGNTVYVGATGAGVWKSTNAAQDPSLVKFVPVTDTFPNTTSNQAVSMTIGALTVQPGGTGVVLAGTGDPNNARDSYWGSGILRSPDGGTTWSLIEASADRFHNHRYFGEAASGFA